MNRYRKPRDSRRRGAALVEFALVAPLLFTLIFGIIEFGRLLMVQQMITNASREGARQAILDGSSATHVRQTVTDHLKACGISGAAIQVTPGTGKVSFGKPLTVAIHVPFDKVSWLPSPFFLKGRSLRANTVMRSDASY
ncbi:TadE family protein [Rubinisphaera margarita]|uniref:TadE family protein n=1 Tax=Rubinisphaera margarita TaxID=2909586 RepID=UPI001EE9254A|nr:TadE family protein [Rubinisphaera margarita]MCG6157478.1 pilus assembly protein [Rubinisphaera margarita]